MLIQPLDVFQFYKTFEDFSYAIEDIVCCAAMIFLTLLVK